jgi:hypothetical protein
MTPERARDQDSLTRRKKTVPGAPPPAAVSLPRVCHYTPGAAGIRLHQGLATFSIWSANLSYQFTRSACQFMIVICTLLRNSLFYNKVFLSQNHCHVSHQNDI